MLGSKKKQQTILFADIAGSTLLYDNLGDEHARALITYCLEKIKILTKEKKGILIKTIGDEAMSRFNTPTQAVSAAIFIQEHFATDTHISSIPIQLRIGLHHGQVIVDKKDVYGNAVNIAARMVDQAKAGQIITSGETLKQLEKAQQSSARLVDQTRVKGKWKLIDIFELSWGRPEELTMMTTSGGRQAFSKHMRSTSMVLRFEDKEVRVNQACPVITLGRDKTNTVVINDPKVSRLHARIELRKDKFILIDQSTNGTFVLSENGHVVNVRRFEIHLPDTGAIGLGQQTRVDSSDAIQFRITADTNENGAALNLSSDETLRA